MNIRSSKPESSVFRLKFMIFYDHLASFDNHLGPLSDFCRMAFPRLHVKETEG